MAEPPKTPQTGRLYQSSIPDAITGAPNNGSLFAGNDIFQQMANACVGLSSVANLMNQQSMTEHTRVKLNTKRTVQQDATSSSGRKVLNTKVVQVSMGINNNTTPIFMTGANEPFGQFMGGRNAYVTMNIVTNDPDTVVKILSMFKGTTLYESLNNMMQQARGLLKGRAMFNPSQSTFRKFLDRGPAQIFPDETLRAVRLLRDNLNLEQFNQIIAVSVKSLTGRIDDPFFGQEEPMVLSHPLFAAFGMKSFYPTRADISTLDGNPGHLSIVLTCQWIDRRFALTETLRYKKVSSEKMAEKAIAWFATFDDPEGNPEEVQKKVNEALRVKRESGEGSILSDIVNSISDATDSTKARMASRAIRFNLAHVGVINAVAPVLAAYALNRYLLRIERIIQGFKAAFPANQSIKPEDLANFRVVQRVGGDGTYHLDPALMPGILTALNGNAPVDENAIIRTASTASYLAVGATPQVFPGLGSKVVGKIAPGLTNFLSKIGKLPKIAAAFKQVKTMARGGGITAVAMEFASIGIGVATAWAGLYILGKKAEKVPDELKFASAKDASTISLKPAKEDNLDALITYLAELHDKNMPARTGDKDSVTINGQNIRLQPVNPNGIQPAVNPNLPGTVGEINAKFGPAIAPLLYVNLPQLMASYYMDFIKEILMAYDKPEELDSLILQWCRRARDIFSTQLIPTEINKVDEYLGYNGPALKSESLAGGFYGYTSLSLSAAQTPVNPNLGFLITTTIDGSSNIAFDESKAGDLDEAKKLANAFKTTGDFNDKYKTYKDQVKLEDLLSGKNKEAGGTMRNLMLLFMDRLGTNSYNITKSIDGYAISTIKNYLTTILNTERAGYRAACFGLLSLNRLYSFADMLPVLESKINISSPTSIPGVEPTKEMLEEINTLKSARAILRRKVGRRIRSLPNDTRKRLIKRARTLIAYGNNYRRQTPEDRDLNDALFKFMRLYILYFIHEMEMHFVQNTFVKQQNNPRTGNVEYISPASSEARQNPYYLYFISPYISHISDSTIDGVWETYLSDSGGAITVLKTAAVGIVIGVLIALAFEVSVVVGIIVIVTYFIFTIAGILIDSLSNWLNSASTDDTQLETLKGIVANIPYATIGNAILLRLVTQISEDSNNFAGGPLFPPEIDQDSSLGHIVDPDTYLSIPLRYYTSLGRVAYPGFWIYSEKTKDVEKIAGEFQVQTAIIESNNYSLGAITKQNVDATVRAQNLINGQRLFEGTPGSADIFLKSVFRVAMLQVLLYTIKNSLGNNTITEYFKRKSNVQQFHKSSLDLAYHLLYKGFRPNGGNPSDRLFLLDYEISYINETNQATVFNFETSGSKQPQSFPKAILFTQQINLISLQNIQNVEALKIFQGVNLGWDLSSKIPFSDIFFRDIQSNKSINPNALSPSFDFTNELEKFCTDARNAINGTPPTGYENSNNVSQTFARAFSNPPANGAGLTADSFRNLNGPGLVVDNNILRSAFSSDETETGSFKYKARIAFDTQQLRFAANSFNTQQSTITKIKTISSLLHTTAGAYGEAGFAVTKNMQSQILHDAQKYRFGEKISKMNPTFKLYFLQDNKREWLLLDDYYSYAAVESIEVNGSVKSPMRTARVKLTNFSNRLSNVMADRMQKENPLFYNPSINSEISSIMLKPGCHLMIFLGYGSVLTNDDLVFVGEIESMQGDQIMEIVCTSFGSLLYEQMGVPEPEIVNVHYSDLQVQRNQYSALEFLVRKALVNNFTEVTDRLEGRLGETTSIAGSSAFEFDNLDPSSQSLMATLKEKATSALLGKFAKQLFKIVGGTNSVANAIGSIVSINNNELLQSHNIQENIRIWHTPVNDTRYNYFSKITDRDSKIEEIKKSVLEPIYNDNFYSAGAAELWGNGDQSSNESTADSILNTLAFKTISGAKTLYEIATTSKTFQDAAKEYIDNNAITPIKKFTSEFQKLYFYAVEKYSNVKRAITGEGAGPQESHVLYNETMWNYLQEVLLQLPNHVCTVRPFGERNTLVITDRMRGYYRHSRKHLVSEIKTANLIKHLEVVKGHTLEAVEILLDAILKPGDDSIALFTMWYIYVSRSLTLMNTTSSGKVFYDVPDRNQIEHVITVINSIIETAVSIRDENENPTPLTDSETRKVQAMLDIISGNVNTTEEGRLLIQQDLQKAIDELAAQRALKEFSDFSSGGLSEIKSILIEWNKKGNPLPLDDVSARKFMISLLYPLKAAVGINTTSDRDFVDQVKIHLLRWMVVDDISGVMQEIKTKSLDDPAKPKLKEVYSAFAVSECILRGSEEVLTWALQQGYQRSSSHKRVSNIHYKDVETDIIDNSINLQKGFNWADVHFLGKSKDSFQDDAKERAKTLLNPAINDIDAGSYVKRSYFVSPTLRWVNKYRTFVRNPPSSEAINHDKSIASVGISILSNLVRDYYDGSITLLGDSNINEWDVIYITDPIRDMFGHFEVKEFTHIYNKQQGFVTVVTPGLPAYNDYATSNGPETPWVWSFTSAIMTVVGAAAMAATLFIGIRAFRRGASLKSFLIRGARALRSSRAELQTLSGPVRSGFLRTRIFNPIRNTVGKIFSRSGAGRVIDILDDPTTVSNIRKGIKASEGVAAKAVAKETTFAKFVSELETSAAKIENPEIRARALQEIQKLTPSYESNIARLVEESHTDLKIHIQQTMQKLESYTINDLDSLKKYVSEFAKGLESNTTTIGKSAARGKIESAGREALNGSANSLESVINNITDQASDKVTIQEIQRTIREAASGEPIKAITSETSGISRQVKAADVEGALWNVLAGKGSAPASLEAAEGGMIKAYLLEIGNANGNIPPKDLKRMAEISLQSFLTVNVKARHLFAQAIGGDSLVGAAIEAVAAFQPFGLKGIAGAYGAYSGLDLAKEYIWDPTANAFNAIISNYYGQNALTISGLYAKGEPFVANLDGMQKQHIQTSDDSIGVVQQFLKSRFSANIEAFKEEFGSSITDQLDQISGSMNDFDIAQDNSRINILTPGGGIIEKVRNGQSYSPVTEVK